MTDDADRAQTATWRALGTGVRLVVLDGDVHSARSTFEDVLDRVDRAYSRFRDDSEIVEVNRRAGEPVAISPLLADAIGVALDAARRTDGAVDPTVGRAMRAIGYDVDFDLLAPTGRRLELRLEPIPGWQSVELSRVRGEVRVRRGVELDLGSTGKALAADLAAAAALAAVHARDDAALDESERPGVLVSLGGDIAMAGAAPPGGWRILVAEDSETPTDAAGEVVAIAGGGLATSSTTVRRWQRGDRVLHHLVDPRTGGPVESPWRTASVAAPTCVEANAAATAAIVLGPAAIDWLTRAALPARVVSGDGEVVRLNGWPDPAGDPAPAAP
jgi:thiamine biosynthesis lipoprotein ApbE